MLKKVLFISIFPFLLISCQNTQTPNIPASPANNQNVQNPATTPQQKDSDIKTFTETDLNISIGEGKDFIIKLSSNATTGYKWKLSNEVNPAFLKPNGSEYLAPGNPIPGAGGYELWKFTALKKGDAEIKLKYFRPWETGIPPINELTFKVKII